MTETEGTPIEVIQSSNTDTPGAVNFDVTEYRRVLTPGQQLELQQTFRDLFTFNFDTHEFGDVHKYPDLDLQHISTIDISQHETQDMIDITIFRDHQPDEYISVDDPGLCECDHSHDPQDRELTSLSEVSPYTSELARDIFSITYRMCGLRPSPADMQAQTVEGPAFQALSCIDEKTGFTLMVEPDSHIHTLYREQKTEAATRLGIPVTIQADETTSMV